MLVLLKMPKSSKDLAVPAGGSRREADGGFARFGRARTENMAVR
jgi:hypothetical protein